MGFSPRSLRSWLINRKQCATLTGSYCRRALSRFGGSDPADQPCRLASRHGPCRAINLCGALVNAVARLGDILLTNGLVTPDQIEVALHEKSRSGKLLGTILVELGFISHIDLNTALTERTGYAAFDANILLVDAALAQKLPRDLAERHRIVLLGETPEGLALGMVDPYDVIALDAARHALNGQPLLPLLLTDSEQIELVGSLYGRQFDLQQILRDLRGGTQQLVSNNVAPEGLRHPIVRLVSTLLLDAVRDGASDLHFEPEEFFIRIRQRRDGDLQQIAAVHRDFWPALSSRLKVMSGMNIANRLIPQDGRFSLSALGRMVDFRVAALPGVHGENIVVRVLDKTRALRSLDALGFTSQQLIQLRRLANRSEGLIILTGPTGSGKTTTLYALLRELADIKRNIMTLEDPVEYQLPMLRQTQVREQAGLGFADGVRAILRQDPDVILIGEIRDAETAQMAVRAAMTGHLVFATLHTRDAVGAIPRLFDFGLSPALLGGNLLGIATQRLVRMLCTACNGNGCTACRNTGHKGREVVAEILEITPTLDALLQTKDGGTRNQWLAAAKADGFQPIATTVIAKLDAGLISAAEAQKLSGQDLSDPHA